jgi:NAD(P)-dependent dehydrogenase (short-subunit alcohol dehydrogenase family)
MKTVAQLMNLQGRRALLTGATGHIGQVMAHTLAELGADLVLVDRPGSDYAALKAALLGAYPVNITTIDCDLEIQSEREHLVRLVDKETAGLDILINNAAFVGTSGLKGWVTPFAEQSVETWRRALEVNPTAAFDLAKGLTPLLGKHGRGSIINLGSIYASLGPDYSLYTDTAMGNPAAYAASKGGLLQLTRWLSTTLAPHIRVNSISPGGVFRNQPEIFVQRYHAKTPLQRMATEEDFKGAVAYLASDLSAYVTGIELKVDGGWAAW